MRLKRNFYNRSTILVAKELLGKYLCRQINGRVVRLKITETEAYCGIKDKACHASKGLTPRTKIMFGPPGHAYVYMIYGMYHCLNVVTRENGKPEAVLVRKAEVDSLQFTVSKSKKLQTKNYKLKTSFRGPGILCRELKIDKKLNGVDVCKNRELWLENGKEKSQKNHIKKGKRIGIDYAGEYKDKLWRFYL